VIGEKKEGRNTERKSCPFFVFCASVFVASTGKKKRGKKEEEGGGRRGKETFFYSPNSRYRRSPRLKKERENCPTVRPSRSSKLTERKRGKRKKGKKRSPRWRPYPDQTAVTRLPRRGREREGRKGKKEKDGRNGSNSRRPALFPVNAQKRKRGRPSFRPFLATLPSRTEEE